MSSAVYWKNSQTAEKIYLPLLAWKKRPSPWLLSLGHLLSTSLRLVVAWRPSTRSSWRTFTSTSFPFARCTAGWRTAMVRGVCVFVLVAHATACMFCVPVPACLTPSHSPSPPHPAHGLPPPLPLNCRPSQHSPLEQARLFPPPRVHLYPGGRRVCALPVL